MEARREDGQALLLALGGAFALIVAALALVAVAGAITGKGRAQRAADLAAISAARSMRDDLPRLLRVAARWNVSAALLAAQMAESDFNPVAASPAGAQGVARFNPSTAASYALRNPFAPVLVA